MNITASELEVAPGRPTIEGRPHFPQKIECLRPPVCLYSLWSSLGTTQGQCDQGNGPLRKR